MNIIYLDGKISLEEAKNASFNKTYQFAKRQKTYLKSNDSCLMDPLSDTLLEDTLCIIKDFLAS